MENRHLLLRGIEKSCKTDIRYREDILDNMGNDELIANLFRISQTEQKVKKEIYKVKKKLIRLIMK